MHDKHTVSTYKNTNQEPGECTINVPLMIPITLMEEIHKLILNAMPEEETKHITLTSLSLSFWVYTKFQPIKKDK